jgi:hypothetical protein
MDWEMNLQPLQKSAKVKSSFMHWKKATAAGGVFFAFDLGESGTLVSQSLVFTLGEPFYCAHGA